MPLGKNTGHIAVACSSSCLGPNIDQHSLCIPSRRQTYQMRALPFYSCCHVMDGGAFIMSRALLFHQVAVVFVAALTAIKALPTFFWAESTSNTSLVKRRSTDLHSYDPAAMTSNQCQNVMAVFSHGFHGYRLWPRWAMTSNFVKLEPLWSLSRNRSCWKTSTGDRDMRQHITAYHHISPPSGAMVMGPDGP